MLYAKITFENHETATESCSNLTYVEVFTNYWSYDFFLYINVFLQEQGEEQTIKQILLLIYLYLNSCEEFIRLNLQRCNTHESPQEGHLGPLTFLHFSLV